MIHSNYSILLRTRPARAAHSKRLEQLEQTVTQLQAYKFKAKPSKRAIIESLILAYDELIHKLEIK